MQERDHKEPDYSVSFANSNLRNLLVAKERRTWVVW